MKSLLKQNKKNHPTPAVGDASKSPKRLQSVGGGGAKAFPVVGCVRPQPRSTWRKWMEEDGVSPSSPVVLV